jgi:hypothetical protein
MLKNAWSIGVTASTTKNCWIHIVIFIILLGNMEAYEQMRTNREVDEGVPKRELDEVINN